MSKEERVVFDKRTKCEAIFEAVEGRKPRNSSDRAKVLALVKELTPVQCNRMFKQAQDVLVAKYLLGGKKPRTQKFVSEEGDFTIVEGA